MEENAQNERLEADKKAKDEKQKERLKREAEEEAEEMKAARKKKERGSGTISVPDAGIDDDDILALSAVRRKGLLLQGVRDS